MRYRGAARASTVVLVPALGAGPGGEDRPAQRADQDGTQAPSPRPVAIRTVEPDDVRLPEGYPVEAVATGLHHLPPVTFADDGTTGVAEVSTLDPRTGGLPASAVDGRGLARPLQLEDAPDRSPRIAAVGILGFAAAGLRARQGTGVLWRVQRDDA